MSPYVVAGYAVYWQFPTEVERLAEVTKPLEVNRIARQLDDNSFWVLVNAEPTTWTTLGSSSSVAGAASVSLDVVYKYGGF